MHRPTTPEAPNLQPIATNEAIKKKKNEAHNYSLRNGLLRISSATVVSGP